MWKQFYLPVEDLCPSDFLPVLNCNGVCLYCEWFLGDFVLKSMLRTCSTSIVRCYSTVLSISCSPQVENQYTLCIVMTVTHLVKKIITCEWWAFFHPILIVWYIQKYLRKYRITYKMWIHQINNLNTVWNLSKYWY